MAHQYLYDKTKKYPLLQSIFQEFADKGILEIELKGFELVVVDKVVNLIKKYQPSQYFLTSSVLPILPYVRKALPKAIIGAILKPYLFEDWMTSDIKQRQILGYMKLTKADMVNLFYRTDYSKSFVKTLKKQGFITHCHLYTDKLEEYKKLQELNIDQCTFDNINLLNKLKK